MLVLPAFASNYKFHLFNWNDANEFGIECIYGLCDVRHINFNFMPNKIDLNWNPLFNWMLTNFLFGNEIDGTFTWSDWVSGCELPKRVKRVEILLWKMLIPKKFKDIFNCFSFGGHSWETFKWAIIYAFHQLN